MPVRYSNNWAHIGRIHEEPMGLDMYLYRKLYCKNWDHMKKAEQHTVSVKLGGKIRKDVHPERIAYITEEVLYWRKANAIHKWFVDNVQKGVDDCKEYYVDREDLTKLLDLCDRVLAASELVDGDIENGWRYDKNGKQPIIEKGQYIKDPKVAEELLPTQSGFFFGQTNYDQWYYQDIKRTAEGLRSLLAEEAARDWGFSYHYSSSW